MSSDDIDDRRRAIALFRHAVIADLDYEMLPVGELTVRVVALSQRTFRLPDGSERTFTERTVWSWWSAYKKGGLLVVLWDEDDDSGGTFGTTDDPIGIFVLSPYAKSGGYVSSVMANHYSLLATTEQLLGLHKLRSASSATTMTAAFHL